jgi:hypothetical protein
MVWLELTKADSVNGVDQKTYVNFAKVCEMTWVARRKVTTLFYSPGHQREVKEEPEAILRSLEGPLR